MKHAEALILAEDAWHALKPFCKRIVIAGSIRRLKPECKDVELVAIPRMVPSGLFGDALEVDPEFCAVVRQWPKVKGEPTGKYTQRVLHGGMKLDLFLTTREQWGWQLAVRTGSAVFNRDVLLPALKARGYRSYEGALHRGIQVIPAAEETDVWRMSGLPWMEPWAREG
jgi:DNA polymerase/3'-5' exonuclease PolX